MRCLALLLALTVSLATGATTYYVDCGAASNGAGTEEDPKNTFAGITAASGDSFYLRPNVVCGPDKAMSEHFMIALEAGDDDVVIAQYPSAETLCDSRTGANCPILDGDNTQHIGIYIWNADAATISDIFVRNHLYHNIRYWGTETSHHSIAFARVRLQQSGPTDDADVTYSPLTKGDCLFIGRASSGAYRTTVSSVDVVTDTCSRLNTDHRWWVEATHVRYKGFNAGYDRLIGGHGISGHPLSADLDTNWTYSSGTCPGADCVYYRPRFNANDDEQLIIDKTTSPQRKYQRVADGDTTPAEGYFSIDSGNIYVGFGYDPGANETRLVRQPIHVDCYDCEFAYAYLRDDGNLEGSGFHADDMTPMRCIRCWSYNNEGNGFFFNSSSQYWSGRRAQCINCIAWNNGTDYCTGTSCGKGIYGTGEFDVINSVASGSFRENISVAGSFNSCGRVVNSVSVGGRWGFRMQGEAIHKCSVESSYAFGSTDGNCASTAGDCTEQNPELVGALAIASLSGARPAPGSPLCDAGTYIAGARDFDDLPIHKDIGAFRCRGNETPAPRYHLSADGLFNWLVGLGGLLGATHFIVNRRGRGRGGAIGSWFV